MIYLLFYMVAELDVSAGGMTRLRKFENGVLRSITFVIWVSPTVWASLITAPPRWWVGRAEGLGLASLGVVFGRAEFLSQDLIRALL
jgi:hypothetical protein